MVWAAPLNFLSVTSTPRIGALGRRGGSRRDPEREAGASARVRRRPDGRSPSRADGFGRPYLGNKAEPSSNLRGTGLVLHEEVQPTAYLDPRPIASGTRERADCPVSRGSRFRRVMGSAVSKRLICARDP